MLGYESNFLNIYFMHNIKIDNFKKLQIGKAFPRFSSLDSSELTALQKRLRNKFLMSQDTDLLKLTTRINSKFLFIDNVDAGAEEFKLQQIFSSNGICSNDKIYINWYRFDEIDEMKKDDVFEYFSDLWYPSADDIEIFDDTLTWFVFIRHDGAVGIFKGL